MMGKARKHPRAKSSGFVPGYIQAGETMIEPDEFGYSRGINSEIEESPALKRSRVNWNGDSYGVPKEVLSLSNMSRFERKNLVHKLKMELEQVKDLRKKIACFSSDTVLLSPYSDIHSCSDGPRKPPQENFATFAGSQGKKRHPVQNDKQRTKKGPSRHSESARLDGPTSSTIASLMKECETLHNQLWSHKKGWAFHVPVDPVMLNIPDYFTVIKHPMDLGTVGSRLRKGEYSSPLDFAADVRLTLSNSMAYNPPGNAYHKMAQDLSKYFESKWKVIEKKVPVIRPPVMPLSSTASMDSDIPFEIAPPRKKAAVVNESKLRVEPAKLVMTDGEKRKLSQDLEALEEEFPQNIIDLLREQSGSAGQTGEVEIEIDIDTLSDEILFMVRKLLDDYLREKKKSQEKSEACEMEIVHDSGFSNSPLHPSKGDLLIDEDVDIVGGNDPPVSSHPPLKIEKDAACRNNERGSSSSSSSESGSSSSDSDSCSSGSETESSKASKRTSTEGKKEPGVGINRKEDDNNGEKIVVNDPLNAVGENSMAMDAVDVLPYEETAPPMRQISPGKRYRAALLKNRFADTIMKAREKSLTKGEKADPEKLRIEREEFEKRLREEKLRLQADAKAAEEARRKAEAEAAGKARREREQEREAARQALQKMEKTVEINEGRRFMEDLEMLRATGGEGDQLPTFMVEMSPKFSEDMLGSFKMEGNSNPLEQLGLYMKMDDDEDDEEEDPIDRSERQTLSPDGEEEGEYLVGCGDEGREEPASQKVQDKGNQEDGGAQDSGNQEDVKPINQNEGDEQRENVPEQETEFVDKAEEETKVVDMCEEENEAVVDKGEQETDNVDMGEQETEVVQKRKEENDLFEKVDEETEVVVDKGEQETDNVDMGGQETEVIEKRKEENDLFDKVDEETEVVVDKGEHETDNVDMGGHETEVVDKGVQETTELVEKRNEENELFDKVNEETEVGDKREQEIEAVDMEEQETEVVGNGDHETDVDMGEQETEVDDNSERETEVVDMGEQETEVVDNGAQGTEVVDKRDRKTEILDNGEQETQVVDMGEQETGLFEAEEQETKLVGNREQETDVVDMGEQQTEVVDMEEQETEVVEMEEQATELVGNGEHETDVVSNGEQETDVVSNGEQETDVVGNGSHETDVVDMGEQETQVVDMGGQETEVVGNRDPETEVVGNRDHETDIVDKREQENEVLDDEEQGTEVVDKRDQEIVVVDNKRDQETEVVDNGNHETEVVDKRDQETEILDMEQETEVVID